MVIRKIVGISGKFRARIGKDTGAPENYSKKLTFLVASVQFPLSNPANVLVDVLVDVLVEGKWKNDKSQRKN